MRNRYPLFGVVGARIHAVAMLSLAETQLSASAKLIDVFRSAKAMGSEMGFADIVEAADAGTKRLQSKSGESAR